MSLDDHTCNLVATVTSRKVCFVHPPSAPGWAWCPLWPSPPHLGPFKKLFLRFTRLIWFSWAGGELTVPSVHYKEPITGTDFSGGQGVLGWGMCCPDAGGSSLCARFQVWPLKPSSGPRPCWPFGPAYGTRPCSRLGPGLLCLCPPPPPPSGLSDPLCLVL